MRLSLPPTSRRLHRSSRALVMLLALLAATTLALVVNVPRALACPVCVAPDKITLSGDSIAGTVSVTDPALLAPFGAATFMGFERRSPGATPVHVGLGIELTRYYQNSGVPPTFWSIGFDHMRYYRGAPGQPGFILYEGPLSADANSYAQALDFSRRVGKWFALTSAEDDAINQLLGATNAPIAPAKTLVAPTIATEPPFFIRAWQSAWLPVTLLLVCLVALLISAGFRLRNTRRRPPFVPAEEGGE